MRVASIHTRTGVLLSDRVSRHRQKAFERANDVRCSKHLSFLPPPGLRFGYLLTYRHPLGIGHSPRVAAIPASNPVATIRLQPVTVRVACWHVIGL